MTPRLYKAAEVCEATGLQLYVLRSWEKEFPGIGVQKSQDAPRLYRESDVEWVRRIKELVFGEGLTLAGARRRLEASLPRPAAETQAELDEVLDTLEADARARIEIVRSGLRSILEVLSKRAGSMPVPELSRNGSSQASDRAAGTRRHARAVSSARRAPAKRAKRVASSKRRAAGRKGSSKRKRASA
ncbi:MAG: MerR family transcriptional regulator [Acidobacteria bacterium]|nr:MerR family transcriptional regulator [Acidobacteriota bacterium]